MSRVDMPLAFMTLGHDQEHDDHQQLAAPFQAHPALGGAERDQRVRTRVEAQAEEFGQEREDADDQQA